ncbi:esterase, partial [Clostridium botulinum V891]
IKDLKQVNLELTDEQLITLFNYSQQGLKGLSTFHSGGEDTEYNSHK